MTTSAAIPGAPGEANPAEKKICRSEAPATGSIMGGRRVCKLKSEWAALDKAADDAMQNRRTSNTIDRGQGDTVGRQ